MEGMRSRLGRAWARYGPTQTVFNGPVRQWQKKWVHVSSSPSTVSQSNGHSNSNNGALILGKWTPLSSIPFENNVATPEEQPKRRFRYSPAAVLGEQKKAVSEKDGDQARERENNMLTAQQKEVDVDKALIRETQICLSWQ